MAKVDFYLKNYINFMGKVDVILQKLWYTSIDKVDYNLQSFDIYFVSAQVPTIKTSSKSSLIGMVFYYQIMC